MIDLTCPPRRRRNVTGLRRGFINAAAVAADQQALAVFYASANRYQPPNNELVPFNTFAEIVGGTNWVIARRTPNILARYGDDVICLSKKHYKDAERLARLALTEGFD